MADLRPADGRASAATVLLVLMVFVAAVGAVASFQRAGLYEEAIERTGGVTNQDFVDSEKWVVGAIVATWIGLLVTGIAFIRWQLRHARNAVALAGRKGLGPGWVIGGWFVPLASAVLPALQILGSCRASAGPPRRAGGRGPSHGGTLIVVWITTFTVGLWTMTADTMFMNPVGSPIPSEGQTEHARTANQVATIGYLVLIVAAIVAVAMVRSLTQRQSARIAQLRPAPSAAMPPPGPWGPPPGWSAAGASGPQPGGPPPLPTPPGGQRWGTSSP